MNSQSQRRYTRGYTPEGGEAARNQLREFEKTSLLASIAWALLYLLSIVLVGAAVVALYVFGPIWLAIGTHLIMLVVIARQMRGLELMVHDASHRAWDRSNKRLNNGLANLLIGYPLASTVEGYWESHRIHHSRFGTDVDPCRQRFERMGLGEIDLSTSWAILKAVIRWLPQYNADYYREIGSRSPGIIARWLGWHALVFILPLSAAFGISWALTIWIGLWGVPMLTTLPAIRSVAEAEEHDYDQGSTEFGATYTNRGWLHHALFHPWNDGYHVIHHMFPSIPQRVHHRVHAFLMQHCATYRNGLHRTKVLKRG